MIKNIIGSNARHISITIMLFKKGLSEEEIHRLFEDSRVTFTVTTISERDPDEECPQCGGDGKYDCDSCGGDGEITIEWMEPFNNNSPIIYYIVNINISLNKKYLIIFLFLIK